MNSPRARHLILLLGACIALTALTGCDAARFPVEDVRSLSPLFLFFGLALATLLSEDLTCIGAGILVSRGDIGFLTAVSACFAGIYVGDLLLYAAGRFVGKAALHRPPLSWVLDEDRVAVARQFFVRHGTKIVFTTRVLPGSRTATYFAAGLSKAPFLRLAILFFIAVALWTPLLVGASVLLGKPMLAAFERYQVWALPSIIAVVLILWLLAKLLIPLFSWKGRRGLLCRWRRLVHYEFWPTWAFYLPLLPIALLIMLKHRRFLSFLTATNPGIPHSGIALESKSQILQNLSNSARFVARWTLLPRSLPPDRKMDELEQFMSSEKLDYPIVLKPDIGERGSGVGIIQHRDAAVDYLARCRDDTIAQEYVSGPEFGIFYLRPPNDTKGAIFSITRKKLLHVTGDGRHSLEHLILADERAVSSSPFFFKKYASQLGRVPQQGEEFVLAEIGTHARGSLFLEGEDLITPELVAAIDSISTRFPGFHFGRYDLRAESEDSLKLGKGFKILELNGLTSESTNIYDPGHSLLFAYRTTSKLWWTAADYAERNIENGAPVTSARELLSILREFKGRQTFEA